jgi:hypothetical protein
MSPAETNGGNPPHSSYLVGGYDPALAKVIHEMNSPKINLQNTCSNASVPARALRE